MRPSERCGATIRVAFARSGQGFSRDGVGELGHWIMVVGFSRDWQIERKKGEIPATTVLRTGLLRDLSDRTLAQVAHGGPLGPSVIWGHERLHRELLQTDNRYISAASELAVAALRSCHRTAQSSPSELQP